MLGRRPSWKGYFMQIEFTLDGAVAEFRRNWFTGRAELGIDGKVELLQNPLDPDTHVQLSLTRRWLRQYKGREVAIEAIRPLLLAGFRPHTYRVLVDGAVVAERHGY
jgi:hypothetical protein